MRTSLIIILSFVFSLSVCAQSHTRNTNGEWLPKATAKSVTPDSIAQLSQTTEAYAAAKGYTATKDTAKDAKGNTHNVYTNGKGRHVYIRKAAKSGKYYAVYLD